MADDSSPPTESAPLLVTSAQATAVATIGAGLINETSDKLKKAKADGPLTFRTLGLLGGLAMILSNGLGIFDRFFSFKFAGSLVAAYGLFFGIISKLLVERKWDYISSWRKLKTVVGLTSHFIIHCCFYYIVVLLEMPSVGFCKAKRLHSGIRWYAKFLEYVWGRGAFFFFVGSLQVTNFNLLDWAVGGFMMCVGVTAIFAGIATSRDLRLFKFSITNEAELKEKWDKHDVDKNGALDVKELTAFVEESGVDMTRNEIASTFLALDKNFDDTISYEEFFFWWMGEEQKGSESASYSV
jgi:hypothetical protein